MELLSLGAVAPLALYWMAGALVVPPFVLYVIARWRAHREADVDRQLGVKIALGYFAVLGLQVALLGLTALLYGVLTSSLADDRGTIYRFGLALALSGGALFAAHVVLLRRINDARYPAAARLTEGYNLLLTGSLGFVSVVLVAVALLQKGSSGELGRVAGAMVIVYGVAWVVVASRMLRTVPAEPPATGSPGAPPMPRRDDGPKLPPLGGGDYPPVS